MRQIAIGFILLAAFVAGASTCSSARAGDVLVNGLNMGKLSSMTISYASQRDGYVVIKTIPPATTVNLTTTPPPPPVTAAPLPASLELETSYPNLMALYRFLRVSGYDGTVFVDGIRIRSGAKAAVFFTTKPDDSVRR